MMASSSESCTTNKKTPGAAASPSLLGSLLTTDIISHIAPFLDFRTLLSLRAVNASLLKYVSKQELLSRSVADLRILDLPNHTNSRISAIAWTGWSENDRNALVQSALRVANRFGQSKESRHIIYEEETALNLLTADRSVYMNHFQQRDAGGGEDNVEHKMPYCHWRVTAPTSHKLIDGGTAWLAFKNHLVVPIEWKYDENNPQRHPSKDTSAFARVLFGLLINARSIRYGTFKSEWQKYGMAGDSEFGVLLIKTTDERKFEIEMDREYRLNSIFTIKRGRREQLP